MVRSANVLGGAASPPESSIYKNRKKNDLMRIYPPVSVQSELPDYVSRFDPRASERATTTTGDASAVLECASRYNLVPVTIHREEDSAPRLAGPFSLKKQENLYPLGIILTLFIMSYPFMEKNVLN